MTPSACGSETPALKQCWRRQVAGRLRWRGGQGPRPLAAITQIVRGPILDGLVNVRDLVWIVLHDDLRSEGNVGIRCAVYGASSVPWGLAIGGAGNCRLQKNLNLAPRPGAKGTRFDLAAKGDFLSLALRLDQVLDCHHRHPHLRHQHQPRWPKFWAGVSPAIVEQLTLAGPEFEAAYGRQAGSLAESATRSLSGLTLVPLAYVSHAWRHISAVFADLTNCPRRQVIALESQGRNLCGYDGAIEYDLRTSRFIRDRRRKRRNSRGGHKHLVR